MQLRVLSDYRRQRVAYAAGEIIDVTEDEAAFLLRDAAGTFAVYVEPVAAAPAEPEADKAIKTTRRK
jgi:hypothetical protein